MKIWLYPFNMSFVKGTAFFFSFFDKFLTKFVIKVKIGGKYPLIYGIFVEYEI